MHKCIQCGLEVKNKENFRRHVSSCNGEGTHEQKRPGPQTCKYCDRTFHSKGNHDKHVICCEKVEGVNLQAEYDSGLSIRQIGEKYNVGNHFLNSILVNKRTGYEATAELKKKDPSNFFFGGTRRKSKGEERFKEMLDESGLTNKYNIHEQYHLFMYRLDFAFPDIKLDVEIDGMQHYTKQEIIKRDKEREKILLDAGWTIYRIASKDFLARPNVVFDLFVEFLSAKHPIVVFRYNGQIVDGDKEWTDKRENKILNSNIDFNKVGWTKKLGALLNVHSNTARRWVQNNMPKFYKEKCRTPRKDYIDRLGCS